MNILYYLEPMFEMSDENFRYGSYKSIFLPEIKSLLDFWGAGSEIESVNVINVSMILGEADYKRAISEGMIDERIDYFPIPVLDSVEFNQSEYLSGAQSGFSEDEVSRFHSLVGGLKPDLIMVYENSDSLVRKIWPDAIVLNVMFGAFSRAPFPTLCAIDPNGIYSNSFIAKNHEKIRSRVFSDNEKNFLNKFRKRAVLEISKYNPFKKYVSELHQEYDAVVLLPCQVDDHPAFDSSCDFKNHEALIRGVVKNLPANVCLLVTQHKYRSVVDADKMESVESENPNVIFFENEDDIPDASQMLLPYCDAVVTVSSSIGYQAALWQVPMCCIGSSQLDVFSACRDLSKLADLVKGGAPEEWHLSNDSALFFILARYNFIYRSDVFNGEKFGQLLVDMSSSLAVDSTGSDFYFGREVDLECLWELYSDAFRGYQLRDFYKKHPKIHHGDFLLSSLAGHEVVTFDLFDTLVERPLSQPHMLFQAVEREVRNLLKNKNFPFWDLRRRAEGEVRRPTAGEIEVSIEQIYDKLQELSGITEEQRERCLELELEAELFVCRPKRSMYIYRRYARLLCSKVGIISDFYIGKDFVGKLLDSKGIECDFLYVSETSRTRKHNGSIYPSVIADVERMGFSRSDMLHVGDNRIADGEMARVNGIDCFVFPSAIENFKKSALGQAFGRCADSISLNDSAVVGVLANRFNNSPFNHFDNDSFFRGRSFNLGFAGYGPIVAGFCQWLNRYAKEKKLKDVFFLARDGHIVKEVIDNFLDVDFESKYLYASRRAFSVAACQTREHVIELAFQSFNAQTISDFMQNRFGFEISDSHRKPLRLAGLSRTSVVSHQMDLGKLVRFLDLVMDEILSNSAKERQALVSYLESVGITKERKETVLLVDIGYSGTMQFQLDRLFPDLDIEGAYVLTHNHAMHTLPFAKTFGYLSQWDDHRSPLHHHLNDFVFVYEAGFSKPEGSLIRFVQNEKSLPIPEFIDADVEIKRDKELINMHRGILEFSREYFGIFPAYVEIDIPPLLATCCMQSFVRSPFRKDAGIFLDNGVENNFGGGSVSLIYPLPSGKNTPEQIAYAVSKSKWKQGANAFYAVSKNKSDDPVPADKTHNKPVSVKSVPKPVTVSKVEQEVKNRKLAKLKRNPYMFFSDSKSPLLNRLKFCFKPNTSIGRFNGRILRRLLND